MRGMWALPTVAEAEAMYTSTRVAEKAIWSVLLFRKNDKKVFRFIKRDWDILHGALGKNVHVITLLDSEEPGSPRTLRFPCNYDLQVGTFCAALGVPSGKLPALLLLNASDDRGPPWCRIKLKKNDPTPDLESLFTDLQIAAKSANINDLSADEWRKAVAHEFLNRRSNKEVIDWLTSIDRKMIFNEVRALLQAISQAKMTLITALS